MSFMADQAYNELLLQEQVQKTKKSVTENDNRWSYYYQEVGSRYVLVVSL